MVIVNAMRVTLWLVDDDIYILIIDRYYSKTFWSSNLKVILFFLTVATYGESSAPEITSTRKQKL